MQTTLADLDYPLEERCIATHPVEPRDSARMMVVHRATDLVEHRRVSDLPTYMRPGDLMVLNRSRVIPARLVGIRERDGRPVEGLFIQPTAQSEGAPAQWLAAILQSRRFRDGDTIALRSDLSGADRVTIRDDASQVDRITLKGRSGEFWVVAFEGGASPNEVMERSCQTPLPPYIIQARHGEPADDARDRRDYQTVFALSSSLASIAAPTAGLHFTDDLLLRLQSQGVAFADVFLEVGPGTFKPVECQILEDHPMHTERYLLPEPTRCALEQAQGRVVAVGTTTTRVLESLPRPIPCVVAGSVQQTNILIAPGHQFAWVNVLLTNFHLPRSTLFALVGAMLGLERTRRLYELAQREGYRFYSFGDAMLIVD